MHNTSAACAIYFDDVRMYDAHTPLEHLIGGTFGSFIAGFQNVLIFRARPRRYATGHFCYCRKFILRLAILCGFSALRLSVMARTRRKLAIVHRPELAAHRLFGKRDAELVIGPLAKIDDEPAHDAVGRKDWAAINDFRQRFASRRAEKRVHARRFFIDQPGRTIRIELDHPIANDLSMRSIRFLMIAGSTS